MKVTELFSSISDDLTAVETELVSIIQSPMTLFHDIGTHLVQAGGKRLRPALFLLCAKQSGVTSAETLHLATAIELIHMATLVHDDVIDVAEVRRGLPTANILFGNHASVLTGDYFFSKAFSLVAQFSVPESLKILTDAIQVMCEGEIVQAQDLYVLDQSVSDYYHKINCKTADFIATSCQLGGQCAQYDKVSIEALRHYGYSIGMAFQITDDILDVIAKTQDVGKPTGHDIGQGLLTLPVLYALQHGKHCEELRQLIESRRIMGTALEQALVWIREGSAVDYCYEQVDSYLKQAREVLPGCLSENVYESLITVTDFIGRRIS